MARLHVGDLSRAPSSGGARPAGVARWTMPDGPGDSSVSRTAHAALAPATRWAVWRSRWWRPAAIGLLLGSVAELAVLVARSEPSRGVDFLLYRDYVSQWLSGGGLYAPWQLSGSYTIEAATTVLPVPVHANPSLYPPLILPLVLPFTVLPEILWWVLPLGLAAWCVWRLRPSWPAMAAIGALCLFPRTPVIVLYGNPVMRCVAALAAGMVWRWPAVLVLLKPTLLPFALVGARSRSWWLAAGLLAAFAALTLPLWLDWLASVRNGNGSLLYSTPDVPAMLVPMAAWLGRATSGAAPRSPRVTRRGGWGSQTPR